MTKSNSHPHRTLVTRSAWRSRSTAERGSAALLVVIVLVLLAGAGVAAYFMLGDDDDSGSSRRKRRRSRDREREVETDRDETGVVETGGRDDTGASETGIVGIGRDETVAVEFAPPGTVGIVHYDISAIRDLALARLRDEENLDADDVEEVTGMLEEVTSVTMFALEVDDDVELFVAYRTSMHPNDLMELMDALDLPAMDDLTRSTNGRYTTEYGPVAIHGEQSDDVDDGVILMLTSDERDSEDFLASLGHDLERDMARMVGNVKRSAPFWVAILPGRIEDDDEMPVTVSGWLDPRGDGSGKITMAFHDVDDAENAKEALEDDDDITGAFKIELDDDSLICTPRQGSWELLEMAIGLLE